MKLRIVSDLHFEFHADRGITLINELVSGPFDVLVVAGDLSNYSGFVAAISMLCEAAAPRKVVYVLGNHEGYGGTWLRACVEAQRMQEQAENLVVLERSCASIEGRRFVGCTLWYPHSGGVEPLDQNMMDFSQIEDVRRLLPIVAPASATFLAKTVKAGDIVVTHYLPHPRSIASRYAHSTINGYFLHDVSRIVEQGQAALWVHGHTHTSLDYQVGATRVVCNPFGYARLIPGEPNPEFNSNFDLDI
ncbi:MAG TPA: metallophosphoesterase [Polyangiaceae bacterium]|nr:metallophosphoesterase [Polyangiaceae bacterium]